MVGRKQGLKDRRGAALILLAIAAIAAGFRFPQLGARPMHADEGVNGDRVGTLLEQGRYEYSTADFHGPTLIYAAAAMARLDGLTVYRELNETVLRALPALRNPTISNLSLAGWVAVETIIDEKVVRELIPQLKAAGAEGIIEYPLNKVVY